MKITWMQQNSPEPEAEKTLGEKTHNVSRAHSGGNAAFLAAPGAVYAEDGREWGGIGRREKGKSLLEIQSQAEQADVAVQQDYMTLMSHTMSEEDYAKLQEEGFDFRDMEPEETVTIVDRIKVELARSGQEIIGYTDDLDKETLEAALGSQALANAVAQSFQQADLPLTGDNLEAVAKAWDMASRLEPVDEGVGRYLIDNELEPEIWNLYLAQNSGAGVSAGSAPQFYAEDVRGYYTKSAGPEQSAELTEQIQKLIGQSGREGNDQTRQDAQWLLDNSLPLTAENLDRLEQMREVELPVTEESFAQAAASAIAEGKDPIHADLRDKGENLYEKAVAVEDFYRSPRIWEELSGDVTARRQLEEIRLRMTAEVNLRLLKSGFSLDTAPLEELVEALKQAERELAQRYFPQDGDEQAVEKYRNYQKAVTVTAQLPGLPVQTVGMLVGKQDAVTLEEFHGEGKALQENYEKARDSYETLMTSPRADLGDSIRKAFANVDDILEDLGIEPTEETRKAVRILGYNRMDITQENLAGVMEADRQVRSVVEKLTPAAALKMIRDGVNPLEKSFSELEQYFDDLPEEYRREAERYSQFLYGLESNKAITQEERESFIGIYRLMRQIEKSDGAAVGALVNTQAQINFSNLLSAVRTGKRKKVDVKADDGFGTLTELVRKGESISEQIGRAFAKDARKMMTDASYSEKAEQEYRNRELEQLRQAVENADGESISLLQRGGFSGAADHLLTAQALLNGTEDLFDPLGLASGGRRSPQRTADQNVTGSSYRTEEPQDEESRAKEAPVESVPSREDGRAQGTRLWEILDNRERFVREYAEGISQALEDTERVSLEEAQTSLDVRTLQLAHKQLTVAGALAGREEYFLPVYVGDTLTRVHLILNRGGQEKGTVSVGVTFPEDRRLQADFQLDQGVLSGNFIAESQNEVMELQKLADNFKEDAGEIWSVGRIQVSYPGAPKSRESREGRTEERQSADHAELYRVAKVFLQTVQKRGMEL